MTKDLGLTDDVPYWYGEDYDLTNVVSIRDVRMFSKAKKRNPHLSWKRFVDMAVDHMDFEPEFADGPRGPDPEERIDNQFGPVGPAGPVYF